MIEASLSAARNVRAAARGGASLRLLRGPLKGDGRPSSLFFLGTAGHAPECAAFFESPPRPSLSAVVDPDVLWVAEPLPLPRSGALRRLHPKPGQAQPRVARGRVQLGVEGARGNLSGEVAMVALAQARRDLGPQRGRRGGAVSSGAEVSAAEPLHAILLVGDDELQQANVRRALVKAGLTAPLFVAGDGVEALELLRSGQLPPNSWCCSTSTCRGWTA